MEATDELLELLAPLLTANGSEPETTGEDGSAGTEPGGSASEPGEARERERAQR